MKFIPIGSARKLKIDAPCYTMDSKGEYGYGRMVKEEKTKEGITRTFEIAKFNGVHNSVTDITHVAVLPEAVG